jgi:predicted GTPase
MAVSFRPTLRSVVLFLLWLAPTLFYVVIALIALYQTGWLAHVAIVLPLMWCLSWAVASLWKPVRDSSHVKLTDFETPQFWTETDTQAIQIVEQYRKQAVVDRNSIVDSARYLADAQSLAALLSAHYHATQTESAFHPITVVEVLTVIHLASEDLEQSTLAKFPGSNLLTVGHFARMSDYARYIDNGQKLAYIATSLTNPIKLLFYPLWRKSGSITVELQNEIAQVIYQQYLRSVGHYLIEMFSGRLKGGSAEYRKRFGRWSNAMYASGGRRDLIEQDGGEITIAIMGQVKAGKSSLINALLQGNQAATNILPETRQVQRYTYLTPSGVHIALLDTPGYSEADVSKRQQHEVEVASEAADIVLLVMAANSPAKDADVRMVRDIQHQYRERSHLKPPKIVAVLTHIDALRPSLEWEPPYNWREPARAKEKSIAAAVAYCQELFGDAVCGYACVYTGSDHLDQTAVVDEVLPIILGELAEGQAASLLRAFYKQLSRERLQTLKNQFKGLVKTIGNIITDEVTRR